MQRLAIVLLSVGMLPFALACGTSSVANSPSPTPAPSAPSLPAGFACADLKGGSTAVGSHVVGATVNTEGTYDRLLIQFDGVVPSYTITRQSGATFMLSPSGRPVTLLGNDGFLIVLEPIQDWTSYSGTNELQPGLPQVQEVRMVENFEGVQQWAVGTAGPPCLRVSVISSPPGLAVDVAT